MMKWYRNWRLRKAREAHAKWKARYDELERVSHVWATNVITRNERVNAAGNVAKLEERVETLMREQ